MRHCNASKFTVGVSVFATAVLTLCVSASPAYAQFSSLEGETLESRDGGKVQAAVSCNEGRISLQNIIGTAVGPVAGTFVEHLSLTFKPNTATIEQLSAKFHLYDTGKVVVDGEKKLVEGSVTCAVDKVTGLQTFSVQATVLYSAFINGNLVDQGDATVEFVGTADPKQIMKPFQFTEMFHSSRLVHSLGKVTGGGHHNEIAGRGVTFGFNAQNTDDGMKGTGLVIDRNVGVRIKILTVEAFGQDGTWAAFSGKAEVNGVLEDYRIDVDDLGEPGSGTDTFRISTDSYVSSGVLTGGNIQIHR